MKELIYPRIFLPSVERDGKRPYLVSGAHRVTLEEHADRVLRLAAALRKELSIKRGDRFAVMAANSHQFVELYHAAFLGAGVINPLNLRLAGAELDYILRDSGTEVVFVDKTFLPLLQKAIELAGDKSAIRKVVLIGERGETELPYDLVYEDLLRASAPEVPPEPEEEDAAVLMYTGGTTGLPKGVVLSQRANHLNCYHVALTMGFSPDDTTLLQTPAFHVASMVTILSPPTTGSRIAIVPMFEPASVLDTIEREKVTLTMMVPTMIAMMIQHPTFRPERLRSMRILTYGASPMPEGLLSRVRELLPEMGLQQGYGMTESASTLTLLGPREHREGGRRMRSAGRGLIGIELCIQDEAGKKLPPDAVGEVCARGGNFMTEYWRKPEATQEVFRDGWYHTGDAGYLDAEGYLFLVDRVKDMIVTGGENVYSAEVENAISTHPAVAQVAVVGIPHDTWGEQVHAIVVLRPGAEASEPELIEHARKAIAGYKLPKSVAFRAEPLPLSAAMKVLKRELREPYWKGRTRRIN